MEPVHLLARDVRERLNALEGSSNITSYWYGLKEAATALVDALQAKSPPPWDSFAPWPKNTYCIARLPAPGHPDCGRPAEYIVWGKLFDKEELGPRCQECLTRERAARNRSDNPQQSAIYRIPVFDRPEDGEEAETPVQSSQPKARKPPAPAKPTTFYLSDISVIPDFHRFAIVLDVKKQTKVVVESRADGVHTMSYRNRPPAERARERASTFFPDSYLCRVVHGKTERIEK